MISEDKKLVIKPQPGRLCLSRSGRDKGRYFLIKEIGTDGYVYITDGMMRKVMTPKKKKLKHLELKPEVAASIAEKFENGTKVFDAEIASAIMSYTDK